MRDLIKQNLLSSCLYFFEKINFLGYAPTGKGGKGGFPWGYVVYINKDMRDMKRSSRGSLNTSSLLIKNEKFENSRFSLKRVFYNAA